MFDWHLLADGSVDATFTRWQRLIGSVGVFVHECPHLRRDSVIVRYLRDIAAAEILGIVGMASATSLRWV